MSARGGIVRPTAPAPAPGVWLVLALCAHCNYQTGRYCTAHDVRPRRP